MWLKTIIPIVIWGAEPQAMEFLTKGEVKRAIAVLPAREQSVGIVGNESD